ncbi:MAG: FAD-dependent oxidoreductase [Magnetococcales bacterium]|nr:FAD-dependent oxidoreductase [Magnetococcales bacterium]
MIIIGGGVAGLSAALEAQRLGVTPRLYEAAPGLGGRVRSFYDRRWGGELDNGPHLIIGACSALLALLDQLDTRALLDPVDPCQYTFWRASDGLSHLRCPPLPAPLHLLIGLFRFPGLTMKDRLAAVRLGWSLVQGAEKWAGQSVTQWAEGTGQTEALFQRLWSPLCLAALNEPPASADAPLFLATLKETFLDQAAGAIPMPARVTLDRLLITPAAQKIRQQGGAITTRWRLRQIQTEGNRVTVLKEAKASLSVQKDPVVLALPSRVISRLMPEWAEQKEINTMESAPIVSLYFRFDGLHPLPETMLGCSDGVGQWFFDRCALGMDSGQGQEYAVVISGAYREIHSASEELVAAIMVQLQQLVPSLGDQQPSVVRVVRERFASFSPWPGIKRPGTHTAWENLFLAGDWTDTGLPATMEGAVRSGQRAARMALEFQAGSRGE